MSATDKNIFKSFEISEEGLELTEFLSVDCTADEGQRRSDSKSKLTSQGMLSVAELRPKNSGMALSAAIKPPATENQQHLQG